MLTCTTLLQPSSDRVLSHGPHQLAPCFALYSIPVLVYVPKLSSAVLTLQVSFDESRVLVRMTAPPGHRTQPGMCFLRFQDTSGRPGNRLVRALYFPTCSANLEFYSVNCHLLSTPCTLSSSTIHLNSVGTFLAPSWPWYVHLHIHRPYPKFTPWARHTEFLSLPWSFWELAWG